jgi:hypothetical protein
MLVLPLLLVALVGGCTVRLAYNNLDRLARWAISDYISMDEAQRQRFDVGVREVWDWHRAAHLPRYADFFDALQTLASNGTDAEEIEAIVNTIVDWVLEIEAQAHPMAVDLLTSLSDEQVAALRRRMVENNERLARDERRQTLEQSRRAWQRETASRFSRLAGRLTSAQRAQLARESARYQPDTALWAGYRERWQAELLRLLAVREDREYFAAGYRTLTADRAQYYGDALTAVWANNRALAAEMTAWLINDLNPRQRTRLQARLQGLAADFRQLASGMEEGGADEFCTIVLEC